MALIDKLRFHNILTGVGLPEAPSIEFTDALQDTFDDQIEPLALTSEVEKAVLRLETAFHIAVADLKRDAAEREARQDHRLLVVAVGVIAVTVAIVSAATGIIIAFT